MKVVNRGAKRQELSCNSLQETRAEGFPAEVLASDALRRLQTWPVGVDIGVGREHWPRASEVSLFSLSQMPWAEEVCESVDGMVSLEAFAA